MSNGDAYSSAVHSAASPCKPSTHIYMQGHTSLAARPADAGFQFLQSHVDFPFLLLFACTDRRSVSGRGRERCLMLDVVSHVLRRLMFSVIYILKVSRHAHVF